MTFDEKKEAALKELSEVMAKWDIVIETAWSGRAVHMFDDKTKHSYYIKHEGEVRSADVLIDEDAEMYS